MRSSSDTRVSPTSQFGQDMDECKLEKRTKSKGYEQFLLDRISELPYEILVSIVSLLTLKEAGATSVLSRRWQNVWKYTMTDLNFQDVDFTVGDNFRSFKAQDQKLKDQQSRNYVNWVDRVLQQHRGQSIDRFRAYFFLDSSFTSSIDKWIEFALERRVQALELHFLGKQGWYNTEDDYTFPHRLLDLESNSLSLNSCRYSVGFKSIKLLHLRHVGVTGKVLQYFLSNCPALERLTVMFAKNLVSLRVAGPSIALKYLVIKYCPEIKSIEICNSNIVSFVYKGDWIDLLLSNVPLLVEVDIFKRNLDSADFTALAFNRISCCLSQLETLKLSIWGVDHSLNYAAPVLENLKYLELYVKTDYDWDLNHLTSFMKACPSIQKLVLTMNVSLENEHNAENVAECPHHSIKEVEIVGYRGCACALQHVEYLVENAIALEKLIIDPVQRWIWPSGMNRGAVSVEEEAKAREHVKKHLKDRVPSNIEFVCL